MVYKKVHCDINFVSRVGALSVAALLHRNPVSVGISYDSCNV